VNGEKHKEALIPVVGTRVISTKSYPLLVEPDCVRISSCSLTKRNARPYIIMSVLELCRGLNSIKFKIVYVEILL